MGNFCFINEYEEFSNKKKFTCSKCHDTYITSHGRYSERPSCRYHEIDENNFCRGCRTVIKYGHNCYHY